METGQLPDIFETPVMCLNCGGDVVDCGGCDIFGNLPDIFETEEA